MLVAALICIALMIAVSCVAALGIAYRGVYFGIALIAALSAAGC